MTAPDLSELKRLAERVPDFVPAEWSDACICGCPKTWPPHAHLASGFMWCPKCSQSCLPCGVYRPATPHTEPEEPTKREEG